MWRGRPRPWVYPYSNQEDHLEVICDAIVGSDRAWHEDERSAVIFGIVFQWHEVLPEAAEKFGWSEEQITRLARSFYYLRKV